MNSCQTQNYSPTLKISISIPVNTSIALLADPLPDPIYVELWVAECRVNCCSPENISNNLLNKHFEALLDKHNLS